MQTRPKAVFAKAAELTDAQPVRSLGKWMVRHHDDLLAQFASETLGRPDWKSFVVALAENGIARRDGLPIAPATAMRTWNRVKANVAKARGLKTTQTKSSKLAPAALPQSLPQLPDSDSDDDILVFAGGAKIHKKEKPDV